MAIPSLKVCEGRLGEEALSALSISRGRSQWATYVCEVCGSPVGVVEERGKWIPEKHWPSVKYPARNRSGQRHEHSRFREEPDQRALVAESSSR